MGAAGGFENNIGNHTSKAVPGRLSQTPGRKMQPRPSLDCVEIKYSSLKHNI